MMPSDRDPSEKIYIITITCNSEIITRINSSISNENYNLIDSEYTRNVPEHSATKSLLGKPEENGIKFFIKTNVIINNNEELRVDGRFPFSDKDELRDLFVDYFNKGYFNTLNIISFRPVNIPKENYATYLYMENSETEGKIRKYVNCKSFENLGISNTKGYWKLLALCDAANKVETV